MGGWLSGANGRARPWANAQRLIGARRLGAMLRLDGSPGEVVECGSELCGGRPRALSVDESNEQKKRLWAPWRMEYVAGGADHADAPPNVSPAERSWLPGADHDCFLCQAAAASDDANLDRAEHVVWRRGATVAMLNRYPYSNGHLLVAPRAHEGAFQAIPPETHAEIADTISTLLDGLQSTFHVDGFNVGLNLGHFAGAGAPGHLHWHIVPRWDGDHNFMTTLAGTRVIPQSLDAAWEIIRSLINGSDKSN